jgi:hypothetical protein
VICSVDISNSAIGVCSYAVYSWNIVGGKVRPARKAANLTAIYERIVKTIWELQHLTNLWASTAYYRDTVTILLTFYDLQLVNKCIHQSKPRL